MAHNRENHLFVEHITLFLKFISFKQKKLLTKTCALTVLFFFSVNSLTYGLGIMGTVNPLVKREIESVLQDKQFRYATSTDDWRTLKKKNAECVLLSSGKFLGSLKLKQLLDEKKYIEFLSHKRHEEFEALAQIITKFDRPAYISLKQFILKTFPAGNIPKKHIALYGNHIFAKVFQWMSMVHENLIANYIEIKPADRDLLEKMMPKIKEIREKHKPDADSTTFMEKIRPLIEDYIRAHANVLSFSIEDTRYNLWDPLSRKAAIIEAGNRGMRFYEVANSNDPIPTKKIKKNPKTQLPELKEPSDSLTHLIDEYGYDGTYLMYYLKDALPEEEAAIIPEIANMINMGKDMPIGIIVPFLRQLPQELCVQIFELLDFNLESVIQADKDVRDAYVQIVAVLSDAKKNEIVDKFKKFFDSDTLTQKSNSLIEPTINIVSKISSKFSDKTQSSKFFNELWERLNNARYVNDHIPALLISACKEIALSWNEDERIKQLNELKEKWFDEKKWPKKENCSNKEQSEEKEKNHSARVFAIRLYCAIAVTIKSPEEKMSILGTLKELYRLDDRNRDRMGSCVSDTFGELVSSMETDEQKLRYLDFLVGYINKGYDYSATRGLSDGCLAIVLSLKNDLDKIKSINKLISCLQNEQTVVADWQTSDNKNNARLRVMAITTPVALLLPKNEHKKILLLNLFFEIAEISMQTGAAKNQIFSGTALSALEDIALIAATFKDDTVKIKYIKKMPKFFQTEIAPGAIHFYGQLASSLQSKGEKIKLFNKLVKIVNNRRLHVATRSCAVEACKNILITLRDDAKKTKFLKTIIKVLDHKLSRWDECILPDFEQLSLSLKNESDRVEIFNLMYKFLDKKPPAHVKEKKRKPGTAMKIHRYSHKSRTREFIEFGSKTPYYYVHQVTDFFKNIFVSIWSKTWWTKKNYCGSPDVVTRVAGQIAETVKDETPSVALFTRIKQKLIDAEPNKSVIDSPVNAEVGARLSPKIHDEQLKTEFLHELTKYFVVDYTVNRHSFAKSYATIATTLNKRAQLELLAGVQQLFDDENPRVRSAAVMAGGLLVMSVDDIRIKIDFLRDLKKLLTDDAGEGEWGASHFWRVKNTAIKNYNDVFQSIHKRNQQNLKNTPISKVPDTAIAPDESRKAVIAEISTTTEKEAKIPNISHDITETKTLYLDFIHSQLNDERTYTIKYDKARLSSSQVEVIEAYIALLQSKCSNPKNIKSKPFSSTEGSKETLIAVYCAGKDFKGEGHVDVAIQEGELEDYLLRVPGMLNIALAVSNIPEDVTKEEYQNLLPLISYVKSYHNALIGQPLILPDNTDPKVIREALIRITLVLPKTLRRETRELELFNTCARQALLIDA
ncbi:MAG: hypothetical protein ABIH85_07260 [Candidatus Omnitrophota bacterium]